MRGMEGASIQRLTSIYAYVSVSQPRLVRYFCIPAGIRVSKMHPSYE